MLPADQSNRSSSAKKKTKIELCLCIENHICWPIVSWPQNRAQIASKTRSNIYLSIETISLSVSGAIS